MNDWSQMSDEELASSSGADSLSAFEELVRRHEARLYRFFAARANEHDARDLTQTTFIAAYRAIGRFNPRHKFATWLFTIGRRQLIDHYRARAAAPAEAETDAPDNRDPSVVLSEKDDAAAVWQTARRALKPDQFTALWLKYEEEMTVREIARAMGKTVIHVKVLLHRARQGMIRAIEAAPTTGATERKTHETVPCTL